MQDDTPSRMQKTTDPATYAMVVQALYVAYFGRPADPAGLANFESALAAAGAPTDIKTFAADYASNSAIQSLVDAFGTSKESQTLYGSGGNSGNSGTSQAFVTAVFENLLGRAPQASGLAYWSNAIDSGSVTQGAAALSIMAGALGNTTAQGLQDGQLIENRLSVATDFTGQVTQLNGVSSYAGANAAQTARTMLAGVTAATNVSDYDNANVPGALTQIIDAGPNLQLFVGSLGGPGTANGTGTQARFDDPRAIALAGTTAYVIDYDSNVIRKVTADGTVTTLAGTAYAPGSADGTGSEARFDLPLGIAVDAQGNVYVADTGNNTVRKITVGGVVTTLAGTAGASGATDGTGGAAGFKSPAGIATDAAGNVYVADAGNGMIRIITSAGVVSTIASVPNITFIAVDQNGNIYAATPNTVYRIGATGTVSLIAGGTSSSSPVDGTGKGATFYDMVAVSVGPDGNLYVVDRGAAAPFGVTLDFASASIRKITPSGTVTTIVGAGANLFYNLYYPLLAGLAVDGSGNFYFCDNWRGTLDIVTPAGQVSVLAGGEITIGTADGSGVAASFEEVMAMASDPQGNVYALDGGAIRKVTSAGVVTTLAGSQLITGSADGMGSAASFNSPLGIAIDGNGNLFVADTDNCKIRKVNQSGTVSTFVGSAGCGHVDGPASLAQFNGPTGIAFDSAGALYVAEAGYVRKIDALGNVTTLAGAGINQSLANGTGSAAGLSDFPGGIAVDTAGNVYVSELYADDIRKISPAGVVTSFAGALPAQNAEATGGSADGNGIAASFSTPMGMAFDGKGNLYVADSANSTIRKITPDGTVSTIVGKAASWEFGFDIIYGSGGIWQIGFTPGALPGALPGYSLPPQAVTISGSSLYIGFGTGIAVVQNLP